MKGAVIPGEITRSLQSSGEGQRPSGELMDLVYNELRHLAEKRMAGQPPGHTLQATALVHEAWLRLFDGNERVWRNRDHFFRAAAQAMRHILIDRARRKMSSKHGSQAHYVSIDELDIADEMPEERFLLINEALEHLQKNDADLAQVVMLKFFAGLTNAEVADMTGVTERTVKNRWSFAKAWLLKSIEEEINPPHKPDDGG
jgi:RNA polymerase sigma factor (TIGR02999 family)